MAKKEYAFYPGCSSQKRGSAPNYLMSVESMCDKLDVKLTRSRTGTAAAPRSATPVAANSRATYCPRATSPCRTSTCPARTSSPPAPPAGWADANPSKSSTASSQLLADTNEALKEAGLKLQDGGRNPPHGRGAGRGRGLRGTRASRWSSRWMASRSPATSAARPTARSASPANRSRIRCTSTRLIETVGGEALVKYDQKVTCCGGCARVLRAGKGAEADHEHRRIGLRPRRGHDLHPLPAVPGQRRGVPVRNQQEAGHQVQHAGRVLQRS